MLCANLAATVSAHGVYEKYDTEGWGQPVIAVLMQGLSHGSSSWEPADKTTGDDSALLASSQSSTVEIPDVLAGQPEPAVSGSVTGGNSDGQQGRGATGSGNGTTGSDSQQNTGATGSGNGVVGSDEWQSTGTTGATGSGNGSHDSDGRQSTGTTGSGNSAGSSDGWQSTGTTGSGNSTGGSGTQQGPGTTGSGNGTAVPTTQQNPDSTAQAEPKQYAFTEVPQEYFDDALFIGDSRVTGVELYSGWDNLTYYAEGGMTIYNMFQSKTAQVDGQTLTIEEALQKRSFGKIYLEIGINEMGTGNVDSFMEAYEAAVEHLRELQPDAILYVCGIMYVKQSKSESDPIFNNPAIQERNDRIAALADGESIFYLDINEVVTDDTGNLNPDYTWDEVHLLGKYDVIWLEYFSSHGIVKDS